MTPDKILVAIVGALGIGFTYWFFLMKNDSAVAVVVGRMIDIEVLGGYKPANISIKKGETTTITFLRRDPSSCLEEVVLPDFKIRTYLPLHKKTSITITPDVAGEYQFSCGMNMFHGKIIVT